MNIQTHLKIQYQRYKKNHDIRTHHKTHNCKNKYHSQKTEKKNKTKNDQKFVLLQLFPYIKII